VLAALAAALHASHDVDPEQLHGNASASAAALRARQQVAPPVKPRWGVTGVHSGSGGHASTAGGGTDTDPISGAGAARDAGLATESSEGMVTHGGSDANADRSVSRCRSCSRISGMPGTYLSTSHSTNALCMSMPLLTA
jgi:hypothetical protein